MSSLSELSAQQIATLNDETCSTSRVRDKSPPSSGAINRWNNLQEHVDRGRIPRLRTCSSIRRCPGRTCSASKEVSSRHDPVLSVPHITRPCSCAISESSRASVRNPSLIVPEYSPLLIVYDRAWTLRGNMKQKREMGASREVTESGEQRRKEGTRTKTIQRCKI
jgi:hypothetical protein